MSNEFNSKKCRNRYFLLGFLFGVVFPLVAFSIRTYQYNTDEAIQLMSKDPLLWIICLAPFILGAAAYFAGIKQDQVKIRINECKITESKLIEANNKINKTIEQLEYNNAELLSSQKTEEELKNLENEINHYSSIIEKIGKFDLTVNINSENKNSHLADVLCTAILNLKNIVNDLTTTVKATTKVQENINQTSSLITEGVDRQKIEIDETSQCIEDLGKYINLNNENAHLIAEFSNETYKKISFLNQLTNTTSERMDIIHKSVDQSSKKIMELFESSEKIGGIVNLIVDIANQTKLLALNASIEAARAGDAGRGFAVVADEVGKLSEKTQNAVSEISDSIKGIQLYTKQTVSIMNEGKKEVTSGKSNVKEVYEDLKLLEIDIQKMVKNTDELAQSSQKQYEISTSLKRNIKSIDNVAESNFNYVHEINYALEEFDNTVNAIKKMIQQFKIAEKEELIYF